jgi:hypothetical protein
MRICERYLQNYGVRLTLLREEYLTRSHRGSLRRTLGDEQRAYAIELTGLREWCRKGSLALAGAR